MINKFESHYWSDFSRLQIFSLHFIIQIIRQISCRDHERLQAIYQIKISMLFNVT